VRPFTPAQIKLLETFADQAVIAIENVRLFNELKESLEQQTATSEILGVIASSPTDIQPVLDTIAQSAARVCGSDDATIRLIEENTLSLVAHYGTIPPGMARMPLSATTRTTAAILQRRTVHSPDVLAEAERFPDSPLTRDPRGIRTFLVTPLLREGTPIGLIGIRRTEVKPFTEKQMALLETFASQAVIAIENVRLFKELQARNRDLTEALEQQTATSEILSVISSSPTDVQPVFDTIVKNATQLCEGSEASVVRYDGELVHLVAQYNISAENRDAMQRLFPRPPTREFAVTRAVLDCTVIHIPDVRRDAEFRLNIANTTEVQALLAVPLLRDEHPIGAIGVNRSYPGPYTETQIALLKTFADQAVIAIENARLFQEFKESLEQQTATSEILGVIASSPTDIQPVLDVVAENAARLCDATDAVILRIEGNVLQQAASYGTLPPTLSAIVRERGVPMSRGTVSGRAVIDRKTIHVHDVAAEIETEFPEAKPYQQSEGFRTVLATPLLREDVPIGVIWIHRMEVRPFTPAQIKLLETFAAQAVIAIENVRLFQELEARTSELVQSVGELRALGEVGQAVSSTLDLQTVLSTIVRHAVQLSRTDGGVVYEYDEAAEVPSEGQPPYGSRGR
jgi:GAF domain-containing protein